MPRITASMTATVPAGAAQVFGIIADYRSGHQLILPTEYFGRFEVLSGGQGAGTRIRFETKAFGRVQLHEADITEPVPGHELRETLDNGMITTYLVEPTGPSECHVSLTTAYQRRGFQGWVERLLVPGYLRRVFAAELKRLAELASAGVWSSGSWTIPAEPGRTRGD